MRSPTFGLRVSDFEVLTNVKITGQDGRFFQAYLAWDSTDKPTNDIIFRQGWIQLETARIFDHDFPADENRDNVYTFGYSVDIRGETLSTTVSVTVTDVADNPRIDSVKIDGEALNQLFGLPISTIPDVTGDGRPEIGVSIMSGRGPASAYVIGSEFYGSIPKGVLNIANLASQGARFLQTPDAALLLQDRSARKANLLSSAPRPSGGVDLLLSDAQRRKFYLFPIAQPSDFNALRGNVDPETVANRVVYTLDASAFPQQARLIGDVNGDGLNDIFVQQTHAPPPTTLPPENQAPVKFGIIFGRPVNAAADRQRTGAFDITFDAFSYAEGVPYVVVKTLSDFSGDGFPELFISATGGPAGSWIFARPDWVGAWIVKSPILRRAAPSTVSLRAITSDPVIHLSQTAPGTVFEVDDTDGDGFRSIAFGSGVVDGDDLNNGPNPFPMGASPPVKFSLDMRLATAVGDLEGDGINDYLSLASGLSVIRGALLNKGLAPIVSDPAIPGTPFINLALARPFSVAHETGQPAYLAATGQVAIGTVIQRYNFTSHGDGVGRIIIVKDADIRQGVLTARNPQPSPDTGMFIR
ncbi:MAG TPA: hypothetical protein VGO52_06950 [Hyphomonadaceae bacterium]|nr:hypothetical protein [Hyphomonadaceae bacterium]